MSLALKKRNSLKFCTAAAYNWEGSRSLRKSNLISLHITDLKWIELTFKSLKVCPDRVYQQILKLTLKCVTIVYRVYRGNGSELFIVSINEKGEQIIKRWTHSRMAESASSTHVDHWRTWSQRFGSKRVEDPRRRKAIFLIVLSHLPTDLSLRSLAVGADLSHGRQMELQLLRPLTSTCCFRCQQTAVVVIDHRRGGENDIVSEHLVSVHFGLARWRGQVTRSTTRSRSFPTCPQSTWPYFCFEKGAKFELGCRLWQLVQTCWSRNCQLARHRSIKSRLGCRPAFQKHPLTHCR